MSYPTYSNYNYYYMPKAMYYSYWGYYPYSDYYLSNGGQDKKRIIYDTFQTNPLVPKGEGVLLTLIWISDQKEFSMDADKEIDVNGVKRTSEVADRKLWTVMEIRKADKHRSQRLELYVYRVKNNLDVFTGEKIEDKEN